MCTRYILFISAISITFFSNYTYVKADSICENGKCFVNNWDDLKNLVQNGYEGTGTTIYLTEDITGTPDNPIVSYKEGTIINGQGHKISSPHNTGSYTQFGIFNFNKSSKDFPESKQLTFTNVYFEKTSDVPSTSIYDGLFENQGAIRQIQGAFSNNINLKKALLANTGTIDNIESDFINNTTTNSAGAVIYNYEKNALIKNLSGNFQNNKLISTGGISAQGGVIYNNQGATILNISGNFTSNSAEGPSYAYGGAIMNLNNGNIGTISGNFVDNYVSGSDFIRGGAIYNRHLISNIINSNFYNNYAQTDTTNINTVQGGAIYTGTDLLITANNDGKSIFSGNKILYKDENDNNVERSEAIYIDGKFSPTTTSVLSLNAVKNGTIQINDGIRSDGSGTIKIIGDNSGKIELNGELSGIPSVTIEGANLFIGKEVNDYDVIANGGSVNNAILIGDNANMFVNSGAVANNTILKEMTTLSTASGAMINHLTAENNSKLTLDAQTILSGNIYLHKESILNGTYNYGNFFIKGDMSDGALILVDGLNDKIAETHSLATEADNKSLHLVNGDYSIDSNVVDVYGWDSIYLKDNSNVYLSGNISLANNSKQMFIDNSSSMNVSDVANINGSLNNKGHIKFNDIENTLKVAGNYTADNGEIIINVDPSNNIANKLVISGDVSGTTLVTINPINSNEVTQKLIFVEAPNDNLDTGAHFNIYRVLGDAHVWNSLYENNYWYIGTNNVIEDGSPSGYPDGHLKPSVVAEVISYGGLPNAGIEQTRNLFNQLSHNINSGKQQYATTHEYTNEITKNVWANPVYSRSIVKSPYKYDADISGIDAGFDIQRDFHNQLGVLLSYRHGRYDFNGNSDYFQRATKSKIDLDSYLAGVYYNYLHGQNRIATMIFGGMQHADISTADGINAKTDGIEYGASLAVEKNYALYNGFVLKPGISANYVAIHYDNIHDNYKKTAKYDLVRNLETEIYLGIENMWNTDYGAVSAYFKPSMVQNFGSGDVRISGIEKMDSLDNLFYGKIETGINLKLNEQLDIHGSISHSFGNDYQSSTLFFGVDYSF